MGSSLLPAGLDKVLGSVTQFTGQIGNWKQGLGSMLDSAGLDKLQGFAKQAGQLGQQVNGFKNQVSAAMADPLGAIGSKLSDMGSLNLEQLKGLVPAQQMKAVEGFTGSAKEIGDLTNSFLKQFGG